MTQREAVHSREERSLNDRIKSLEGRVRRVLKAGGNQTVGMVVKKGQSSSNVTSSVNTSIHNEDQGNNSSIPSEANKERVRFLDDSSSSYVLYDQNMCSSNE